MKLQRHEMIRKSRRLIKRTALAAAIGGMSIASIGIASPANAANTDIGDERVELAIDGELWGAKGVEANGIDVSVTNGIVTLSGEVSNLLSKEAAIRIAGMTKGVRSVVDQVTIKETDQSNREIRADVVQALAQDPATESWEIMVQSSDRMVTLDGEVDSWAERELAGKIAKSVRGVTSLDNNIEVDYDTERLDSEVRKEVEQRLNWDARLDDELVNVTVKDGVVSLAGTVGSAYEKTMARSDAWVNGVTDVESDNLKVAWWSRDEMQRKTSWSELSDKEIRKAVNDAFLYDPRVLSFNPEVTVENGVVTLTGAVDNLKAKRAAAQTAKNTVGVIRVKNYLRVRPVSERPDTAIKGDITDALARDPFVDRFDITTTVIDGAVYLYGDVDSYFDRAQAENLASKVNGVTKVENYLDVSYDSPNVAMETYDWDPTLYDYEFDYRTTRQKSDDDIREEIKDELWWSPFVDSDEVSVKVDDGTATLTGTVDSWSERRSAGENAIDGGAVRVINKLDVQ